MKCSKAVVGMQRDMQEERREMRQGMQEERREMQGGMQPRGGRHY
ncbi:MAG: hypothetical protein ACXWAT_05105 [Methylobacter sp.]